MKNLSLILVAAFFLFASCEYNPGISEAFTKYRFKEGVTTITVPGWVIGLVAGLTELDDDEQELLQSIDKVRVLVVENEELNGKINLHREFSSKINRGNKYEELLTVNDKNENVTIYGVLNDDIISEMVILVGGEENALVYVRGEISAELLKKEIRLKKYDEFLSLK